MWKRLEKRNKPQTKMRARRKHETADKRTSRRRADSTGAAWRRYCPEQCTHLDIGLSLQALSMTFQIVLFSSCCTFASPAKVKTTRQQGSRPAMNASNQCQSAIDKSAEPKFNCKPWSHQNIRQTNRGQWKQTTTTRAKKRQAHSQPSEHMPRSAGIQITLLNKLAQHKE